MSIHPSFPRPLHDKFCTTDIFPVLCFLFICMYTMDVSMSWEVLTYLVPRSSVLRLLLSQLSGLTPNSLCSPGWPLLIPFSQFAECWDYSPEPPRPKYLCSFDKF